jgi:uncharacterized protein YjbI with pentapeptide repeats
MNFADELLYLVEQRRLSENPLNIPIMFELFIDDDEEEDTINFSDINLQGANLSYATFKNCTFENVTFDGAIFENTLFSECSFQRCRAINANFDDAVFQDVVLSDSNFTGARFQRIIGSKLAFSRINFRDAIFEEAVFQYEPPDVRCRFIQCTFGNTNFNRATINNSIFSMNVFQSPPTTFNDAILRNIIMHGNNFLNHINVDITNAQIQHGLAPEPVAQAAQAEANEGRAYEIHHAFNAFLPKKDRYLQLIKSQFIDEVPLEFSCNREDILEMIYQSLYNIINLVSENGSEKNQQLHTDLDRINASLNSASFTQDICELIWKSLEFVLRQNTDFQREYINIFIEDSLRIYSTPQGGYNENSISCVNGIKERLVTAVGAASQVFCTDNPSCDPDNIFYQINKLMNFDIADVASEWFENASKDDSEIQSMNKTERKQNFIEHLQNAVIQINGALSPSMRQTIDKYANDIDYSFEKLQLGGLLKRKTRKLRKGNKPIKTMKPKRRLNKRTSKKPKTRKQRKTQMNYKK